MNFNPFKYSLATRLKEKPILDLMDIHQGEKVLDLGCGLGYFYDLLKNRGADIVGMDFDFHALSLHSENKGKILQASACILPFKSNSFDKILFTDVIEHLPDDKPAVKEIFRILKPGGKAVITTEAKEGVLCGTRLNILFHDVPGTPEYHFREGYSAADMKKILSEHKLQCGKIRYASVFLGEVFMELLKAVYYLMNSGFKGQGDSLKTGNSPVFKIYQYLFFPVLFLIGEIETRLLAGFCKGHLIFVEAIIPRT